LPLGISFMTFQGLAYVVDVWRGDHPAEYDLLKFLCFKTFFPQLIAGPIERAGHLLTQFGQRRTLDRDKVAQASWLLTYGYFLKLFAADGMAPIVDSLFVAQQPFAWSVVLGSVAFGVQIYADFCGYSLIAKGTALLLGFNLIWNFHFPYWSVSIREFWRRWHISLSQWLRDYLYIPLGGSRRGKYRNVANLLITMGLGGLWHGAAWNFVLWGLLHGVALAVWRILPVPAKPDTWFGRAVGWAATMLIVFTGWFLFRARSFDLMAGMLSSLNNWEWAPVHSATLTAIVTVAVPIAVVESLSRRDDFFVLTWPRWATHLMLSGLTMTCMVMLRHYQVQFIYFQF
jgi:D-alanyl-lipoteichoic acid acyltransferase DltB (MBOAT superfamily)